MAVLITKADGETEHFDPAKLEHSLQSAGASSTVRARILAHVLHDLQPGTPTEEIYQRAYMILKSDDAVPVAARYSVKRAVFALGPSGFPFEQFIAEILRGHGWRAHTGAALAGRCASHEVDVVAEKDGKRIGVEAKFHNDPAGKTDIKDALYVRARFDDLKNASDPSSKVDEGWLVTNTRFTHNAIRYAQCANLTVIGWDHPRTRGLLQLIEEARVHPLTCLTTLSESEKRHLLDNKIVLCKSVQAPHLLHEYGIRPERIPLVIEEAKRLCDM